MSAHLTAQIKSRLDHPIIDADGHWIEYGPVFTEQLRKVGGEAAVRGWTAVGGGTRSVLAMSVEERRRRRISQEAFWAHPAKNTRDFATAILPRLLYERLDEIGLDFAIIYPTGGLRVPRVGDGEGRRAASRAYNIVTAEYFRPFADRMTPAAIIPMHTPEEAIEELEFAVKELGYKVAMLGSLMDRPIEACGKVEGEAARFAVWHDVIGLDSAHDYRLMYEARAEPAVSTSNELVISYNINSIGNTSGCVPMSWFTNTVTLPRFIAVPLTLLSGAGGRADDVVTAGPPSYPQIAQRAPAQWFNEWNYPADGCPAVPGVTSVQARPGAGAVALSWPDAGLGVAYRVYLRSPGTTGYTLNTTVSFVLSATARISVTLSGLAPGEYVARVVPVNLRQQTGHVAQVTFTVPAA